MDNLSPPQFTVKEALEYAGNNQAKLARLLGITKAGVNAYVKKKRVYLPDLQAYKFRDILKAQENKGV